MMMLGVLAALKPKWKICDSAAVAAACVYGSFCLKVLMIGANKRRQLCCNQARRRGLFGRFFSVLKFQLFESGMSLNSRRSMLSGFFLLPQLDFFWFWRFHTKSRRGGYIWLCLLYMEFCNVLWVGVFLGEGETFAICGVLWSSWVVCPNLFAWGFIILIQLLWCSCICILSDISVCKRTIALFGHEPGALFFVPFFVSV